MNETLPPPHCELVPRDVYDEQLLARVRPSGWRNPEPKGRYNLVVIGGGTAGLVSAMGAAGLGAKVALVERDLLGGDCLNTGCVPSKAWLRSARAAYDAAHAGELGVSVGPPVVDFAAVMERMRRLRSGLALHDSAERLTEAGVDVFLGSAALVSSREIEVGGQRLSFARAVIATGARAAVPRLAGLAEAGFVTSETVFSLKELPRRLLVIGAGPIGCELGQAFRRFGSEVSIISRDPRLLPREGKDAAAVLRAAFEAEQIRLALGARALRVERRASGKAIVFEHEGKKRTWEGEEILVAIGRMPNLEGLALDAAGVAHDDSGVVVNDRLRTSARRIYAAGDVCSRYKFTHAADAMARVALQNALFFGRKRASSLVIPRVTYTDPEVAHVGLTDRGARELGSKVLTFTVNFSEVDRAVLESDTDGFARLHVGRRSGRILGGTVVARHAGEMVGELVLAMTQGVKVGALSRTIHPYPTQGEVWRKLGDAYQRTRLSPGMGSALRRFLVWRRS